MGASTGSKFYYQKGYVRVSVKIDPKGLFLLKSLAIDEDKSVIAVTEDAVTWILNNADMIPSNFPPYDDPSTFYTFVKKVDQKKLKKISALIRRPLCDVIGFIVNVWTQAHGQT